MIHIQSIKTSQWTRAHNPSPPTLLHYSQIAIVYMKWNLITNKRRIGKEMLNQGLLEGNPSFSFLYLASSGRPLAGNGRTAPISSISTTVDRSMDLCRPVDACTGSRERKGKRGKWGEMRVRAIVRVMGSELLTQMRQKLNYL